jgi:hypothetical protein
MTDEVTAQAQQLSTDILAELERAVAQKDAVKEKDIVVDFAKIKKIQEDARAAFAAIVSDYMAKRQALADQARQAKIQSIKASVAQ